MSSDDFKGTLDSKPYTWQEKKGEVRITWKGKIVTVLRKESAIKFLERISVASDEEAQLIMAKATGNFKRGNERRSS
ncbi:hypothetical protein EU528_04790 [Candidatus Thorarchaeota archaeon]|nr:MAG: hypothetical protein EU528_04790 [Candidatus Thorarchaeota archaeon]